MNMETQSFVDVEEAFSLQIPDLSKGAYKVRKYPSIGKLESSGTFLFIAG